MTAAPPTFGAHLRALRQARGMSQRELAERVGIDHTYLSKLETGARELDGYGPSPTLLVGLSLVLRADAFDLFIAAGKVPIEVAELMNRSDAARAFYRRAVALGLSDAEWDRLRQAMEQMAGGGR